MHSDILVDCMYNLLKNHILFWLSNEKSFKSIIHTDTESS